MDGFIFRKTEEVETELSPEEMGRAFAEGSSDQQSTFLNEAFNVMDGWKDACGVWQVSYMAQHLSKNSERYLRELVAHFDGKEA